MFRCFNINTISQAPPLRVADYALGCMKCICASLKLQTHRLKSQSRTTAVFLRVEAWPKAKPDDRVFGPLVGRPENDFVKLQCQQLL